MFFFNLGFGEFLALFAAVSGVTALLYLLDRSRQKLQVATLRFWKPAPLPTEERQRRKIQQPWSLLLQIVSMGLLLLAIAQLRWGSPEMRARDHVLVLDTSAWMAARIGRISYMDQARLAAKAWLDTLPGGDRVMLIRADAAAAPATAFESKREVIRAAIDQSRPSSAALRFHEALQLADTVRRTHATLPGELVFAGAARVPENDETTAATLEKLPRFRLLPVKGTVANVGLRRIGVRRSSTDPEVWQALVGVRNYGVAPRTVPVEVRFGGAPAAARQLTLAPGAEQEISFDYRTKAAGPLEARVLANDGFPEDNRAILDLPAQPVLRLAVYSPEPDLLRPVLSANPRFQTQFFACGAARAPEAGEVVILDRCPPVAGSFATLRILPAGLGRPLPPGSKLRRWHTETPLGAGLRSPDVTLDDARVFDLPAGALPIAETDQGVAAYAESGAARVVTLGFHPLRSSLRYQLAGPLVFANALGWLAPESFRHWEMLGASVGTVSATLEDDGAGEIKVLDAQGAALPFTAEGRTVRFFAGAPGTVRLTDGRKEMTFSLTLPEVGEREFVWPKTVRRGVPAVSRLVPSSRDLWPWLAVLGALGLLADWFLFGLGRRLLPLAGRLGRAAA